MGMEIRSFVVGPIDVNCYVVQDTETKQGMIIDPGGNGEAVWQYIRQASIDVQSIVNTHAHGDHIGAVDFLRENPWLKKATCANSRRIWRRSLPGSVVAVWPACSAFIELP